MAISHLKEHRPGIGKRLRAARGRETQLSVAARAGCGTGVLIEAERRDFVSPLTLVRLARALGVTVEALLGDETSSPTPAPEAA